MEKQGIGKNLYNQYLVGRYCDLHIEVENTTFKAHRCVVAAASWVLEAILHSSAQDSLSSNRVAIQLHGVTSYAISALLAYIYTGKLDPELFVDNNKQREVLHAAKLYKLDDITSQLQPRTSAPGTIVSIAITEKPNEGMINSSPSQSQAPVNSGQVFNELENASVTEELGCDTSGRLSTEEAQEHVSHSCKFARDHKLLYCILCSMMFSNTTNLITHMSSHRSDPPEAILPTEEITTEVVPHNETEVIPDTPEYLDDNVDDVKEKYLSAVTPKKRRKVIAKKSFACVDCDVSHASKAQLVKHYRSQHPDTSFCEFCGDRFASVELYKMHMETHKTPKNDEKKIKRVETLSPKSTSKVVGKKPKKIYTCNLCETDFPRKKDLSDHQRTLHGILKLMHVCTVCGREFKEKAGLRTHTRVHTGEKPYMCSYCGNSFADQKTWKDHERRHRGEKPFLCTTCGKSFTYRQSFTRHMKFHEGKRPFQCSFCGKAFVLRQNLREHEKRHNK